MVPSPRGGRPNKISGTPQVFSGHKGSRPTDVIRMSSVAQITPASQAVPAAILQFRPSICPVCLQPPPTDRVMNRVRIRPLKRYEDMWSVRCRCPRPACRTDFSVRLSFTEKDGLKVSTLPDALAYAYSAGNGTAEEIAHQHGLHCGSTVWRVVDAATKQVEEWIGYCNAFLKKHCPEALNQLLWPQPPVPLAHRRFRKPARIQHLALLRELPRWANTCIQVLGKEWPYGMLRFLRTITPRFDGVCRSD